MIRWIQITSGRGPEECRWVVARLTAWISREVQRRGYAVDLIEAVAGDFKNTLKSAVLAVKGDHGLPELLQSWTGTVQWVGQSMFRPTHKRKNWFVRVSVLEPFAAEQWPAAELKIERMRSSGPGGQHANKTETAVRVRHLPSGISVFSQAQRCQQMNLKLALAKLGEALRQKQERIRSDQSHARWQHHNRLERGNARLVFLGPQFRRKQ